MKQLKITIESMAGSQIDAVCKEAQRLSDTTDSVFQFEFNGDIVDVKPGYNPEQTVTIWYLRRALRQATEKK